MCIYIYILYTQLTYIYIYQYLFGQLLCFVTSKFAACLLFQILGRFCKISRGLRKSSIRAYANC